MQVSEFQRFLDASPRGSDDILLISAHRKFSHDEEGYDEQYQISPYDYLAGQGLNALVHDLNIDTSHAILELGCRSGRLSLGLGKSFDPGKILITDASSIFLEICRKKFQSVGIKLPHLGLLRFEDIDLLPEKAFSLVVLRSALHHVNDYPEFIAAASRRLVPGGAVIFEEPLHEGLFLLGLIAKFLKGHTQDEEIRRDLQLLADVMSFYCRTDLDKSASEDKFAFKLRDILGAADLAGLQAKYYLNKTLESFAGQGESTFVYADFAISYLKFCMGFDEKTVSFFQSKASDVFDYISMTSGNDRAPESFGVFALIRSDTGLKARVSALSRIENGFPQFQLASTDVEWLTFSKRDPNGRVFRYGDGYYRAIYEDRAQFMKEVVLSEWFLDLVSRDLLIQTTVSPLNINGYGLVLSHRGIYFRCHPAEMTFEFIRDAALALCSINAQLLKQSLSLIDAHLWNFVGGRLGRPVWIDVGSITQWSAPAHMLASQEFIGQYVLPLLVKKKVPHLNRISRLSLGSVGFTLDEARAVLGDATVDAVPSISAVGTIEDHRGFWSHCEELLQSLDVSKPNTYWQNYYGKSRDLFASFPVVDASSVDGMQRAHMLARIIRSCEFSSVIDFGCNEGFYTVIAARNANSVLAVDFDEGALGNFYEMLGTSDLNADFTFAHFDFGDLDAFSAKNPIKADLVMGLALTHHLTLGQGLSFDDVAWRLERYCSKSLLVEYMPNGLAPQDTENAALPPWYTLNSFINAFKCYFSRVEVYTPTDEKRIACLFSR